MFELVANFNLQSVDGYVIIFCSWESEFFLQYDLFFDHVPPRTFERIFNDKAFSFLTA